MRKQKVQNSQEIFDRAYEHTNAMASMGRANSLKQATGKYVWKSIERQKEIELCSECVEYIKDKYSRVFGKNTPAVAIKVYPFSNENIYDTFKHLNVKDKNVLVVGSSGDQAIASIVGGAKDIILADKNPITQFYTELKIAALSTLEKADFEKFLCHKESKDYFSHKYYQKFSHKLSGATRDFWDSLYMDFSGVEIGRSIFHPYDNEYTGIPYLRSDVEYKKTQQALQKTNIHYIIDDVLNFHHHIDHNLDYICLSNIIDYIDGKNDKNFGMELTLLNSKLNPGGLMQYEYSWGPIEKFENRKALLASAIRAQSIKKYLKNGQFVEVDLPGNTPNDSKHKMYCFAKSKYTTHGVLKNMNDDMFM